MLSTPYMYDQSWIDLYKSWIKCSSQRGKITCRNQLGSILQAHKFKVNINILSQMVQIGKLCNFIFMKSVSKVHMIETTCRNHVIGGLFKVRWRSIDWWCCGNCDHSFYLIPWLIFIKLVISLLFALRQYVESILHMHEVMVKS